MSKQNGSRKVGHNKRKPCHIAYTQQMRWERNKRRRIAKEEQRQAAFAATAAHRRLLRKRGALNRITRRLSAATNDLDRLRLAGIQSKVRAALNAAEAA